MPEHFATTEPQTFAVDELLDRLERQAVVIARLRGQVRARERQVAAERQERLRLEAALDAGAPQDDADEAVRRLAEAEERNRVLEHQVEVAWAQLGVLESERDAKPRRWRRFRRSRSTLPPVS